MNTLSWLRSRLAHSASAASELLFPPSCAFCGELAQTCGSSALVCAECRGNLWPGTGSFCPGCALPSPDIPNPTGDCANCREERYAFDAARTLGTYQLAVRQAVLRIKHAQFEPLTMQLGKLLAERIRSDQFSPLPDVVVPVPMHWLKRLWRGTSPAELLAQSAAGELRLPCITHAVRCKRLMLKQSSLPPGERRKNVRGAYAVGWGFDLRGARVLLVDDVITTGSTCSAVARELKRAGADSVYAVAIARATHAT